MIVSMIITIIVMTAIVLGTIAIAMSEIATSAKGIDEEELRHIEAQ